MISSLTTPQSVALQSTIPRRQLPATSPSRAPVSLSRVYMAVVRTVWFSFHIGCTDQLFHSRPYFSSDSDNCPDVRVGPLLKYPHPLRAGPVQLTLLFPHQFLHPAEFCMLLYILVHWSRTLVHSQLEFCIHFCVWRCIPDASLEREFSMPTYSSAILFSHTRLFFLILADFHVLPYFLPV